MDKWWLSVFTALVFQTLHSCTGQPDLICSHGPITVLAGDDVVLPCRLEPSIRAESMTVVWTKPGLDPKYVHYHQDGRLIYESQAPSYYYRTRLFVDELKNGNVSMKIMKVVLSDGGEYICIIPSIQKEASIQLIVGSVSTPVAEDTSNMRTTHTPDPDEFFKTPSSSSPSTYVIIGTVIGIMILIVASVLMIKRQNQKKRRNQSSVKNNQSNSTNHDVLPLNDGRRNSLDTT